MSRKLSRGVGYLCNMPLPPYLRKYFYLAFGKVQGVDFDEILVKDLNNFRTFNDFFTREIDLSQRPIAQMDDKRTLVSPCDGTILSFGEVEMKKGTIQCVKGHDYRLDEFLFGFKTDKDERLADQRVTMTERIIDSVGTRNNKLVYLVIYLAPSDYHRYHSPAHFTANYRRHVVGYLEPVRPSYLEKHRDVLTQNERVNLLGDWEHGFFAMSFIGALNVGSINLHFDEEIATNKYAPEYPYIDDKNYRVMVN